MVRIFSIVFSLLVVLLTPLHLFSGEVTRGILTNHYNLVLEGGDLASVYIHNDGTIIFLPAFTNKDYTHACEGKWRFSEKHQTLKISQIGRCQFLKGDFNITHHNHNLYLRDGLKTLVFKNFQ